MNSGTMPPSTDQARAGTFDARSEQRKATTRGDLLLAAEAPERDLRPLGLERLLAGHPLAAAAWSARPPSAIHSGVSTGPGATAFTSTPSAA